MKDIMVSVCAGDSEVKVNKPILGVKGENLQSCFVIDFSDEFIYGDTATIEYRTVSGRSGSCKLVREGAVYRGTVTSVMTAETPTIKCQLKVQNGPMIFKSKVFTLAVLDCVDDL